MRAARKKRLFTVIYILAGVGLVVSFLLMALSENLDHFHTPTQIANGDVDKSARSLRVGGLVKAGSVQKPTETSLARTFVVTDGEGEVLVSYDGILPDLFREGQGIVVVGKLDSENTLIAEQVLAKHDENYMPPEAMRALEASGHVPLEPQEQPAYDASGVRSLDSQSGD